MLDQRGDVSTIASYVKKKSTEVGRGAKQHQQQSIIRQRGDDGVALLVLEYRSVHGTLKRGSAEALCFRDEGGHTRREVFIVQPGRGETVDQQSVFAQDENGINSGSLTERGCKVSDVGHLSGERLRS